MNILDEIFAHKREEVARRRLERDINSLRQKAEQAPAALDFVEALRSAPRTPALIAEVKHASPSRGELVKDFDPLRLARVYQENGAAAISVLTDEKYFQGSLEFLAQISKHVPGIPLLRKDFFFDPYQIYEARAAGADAILLIAAMLEDATLRDLHSLALELGMTPLVEVHDRQELERVLPVNPRLVGVNNRDLRDFTIRMETSFALRELIPLGVCMVAESGIHTVQDISRMAAAGVDAVLIGEALVTAPDVAAKVRSLAGEERRVRE